MCWSDVSAPHYFIASKIARTDSPCIQLTREDHDQERLRIHSTSIDSLLLFPLSDLEKRYILTGIYERDLESSPPYTAMNGTVVDISTDKSGRLFAIIRDATGRGYTRRINARPPAELTSAKPTDAVDTIMHPSFNLPLHHVQERKRCLPHGLR